MRRLVVLLLPFLLSVTFPAIAHALSLDPFDDGRSTRVVYYLDTCNPLDPQTCYGISDHTPSLFGIGPGGRWEDSNRGVTQLSEATHSGITGQGSLSDFYVGISTVVLGFTLDDAAFYTFSGTIALTGEPNSFPGGASLCTSRCDGVSSLFTTGLGDFATSGVLPAGSYWIDVSIQSTLMPMSFSFAFQVSPVPEPAAGALAGCALTLLALRYFSGRSFVR